MGGRKEPGVDHVSGHPGRQQLAARHAAALSLGNRRDALIPRARDQHNIPSSQHPDEERRIGLLRAVQSTSLSIGRRQFGVLEA
jgi:hypothetical protein